MSQALVVLPVFKLPGGHSGERVFDGNPFCGLLSFPLSHWVVPAASSLRASL
jgi:hypothetical protein